MSPALKKDGTPRKTPVRKPVVLAWRRQPVPHAKPPYPRPAGYDTWWCSGCGACYYFPRPGDGRRGGPEERAIDRRYGFIKCWRVGKGPDKKYLHDPYARMIAVADGAPNPGQPEQDPELLAALGLK